MKKVLSIIIAAVLICLSPVCSFAGKADSSVPCSGNIIISSEADENVVFSAETLCERLNLIYGGYSVKESDSAGEGDIAVGNTGSFAFDFSGRKPGSYSIKSIDGYTAIGGNGTDGLINGVFEFLNAFCGYEVYEKGIIEYTVTPSLSLPDNIDIVYEPYFEYRKVDTSSSYDSEYAHANSLNSNLKFPDAEGGMTEYISWFCHTLSTEFCSADTYFDTHPEYFALRDGKRVPDQLCLSNEETLKIVTDEVLGLLKEKHDPTQNLQIISLTQADNQNCCTCEKCAATDEANGSHAGTMLTFANSVADRVKEEGYTNVAIDTFAYQYTRAVPAKVRPRDNVIIRLCSIECCFAHSVDDDSCEQNRLFNEDLKGWSKICNRLFIWDYVNNYSETFQPFPNFHILQKNVQAFYNSGAKGLYEEGNYYMNICNGEMYELRSFLLCKLMENPFRTDYSVLMDNYLKAVYGPGGKYLREYIDIICSLAPNHPKNDKDRIMHIRQQPKDCLPGITSRQIKQINKLWESAKEETVNEEQLSRIERSEISWEHWKCNRFKGEYTLLQSPFGYMKSHAKLLEKIVNYGNTSVGEGPIKELRKNPCRVLFFPPTNWESKFDGKLYDKFDAFAKWLYELSGEKYDFEY